MQVEIDNRAHAHVMCRQPCNRCNVREQLKLREYDGKRRSRMCSVLCK